jgi:peptidoglycan/LPS O-acetylase OafA/YrhL
MRNDNSNNCALAKSHNISNQLDALLVLRGFACLMVVIRHCAPPRKSIIFNGYDFSWLMCSHGMVAVWIFFCLSGYLMGKAFYTKRYKADVPGVINFWRNRIYRIFPLYYFAVLILSLFAYPDILKMENWWYLIRVCTFTYNAYMAFPSTVEFNRAMWSLSTELHFYIFVPFIYTYLKPRLTNPKKVAIAILSIISLSFVLRFILWISFQFQIKEHYEYYSNYFYNPMITNLDLFLCGFLMNALIEYQQNTYPAPFIKRKNSQIFFDLKRNNALKFIAVLLILLLYLFTAHHGYHQELWGLIRPETGVRTAMTIFVLQPLTAIIISFFIFAFESDSYQNFCLNEKLSFASILKNPLRVLEIFGVLSYGIYIWHTPIILKTAPIITSSIPIEIFYTRLTATLILTTLLASVTYYLVERPAAQLKIYHSP